MEWQRFYWSVIWQVFITFAKLWCIEVSSLIFSSVISKTFQKLSKTFKHVSQVRVSWIQSVVSIKKLFIHMKFSSDYTFLLKDKKRKNESHLFMLKYIKHFLILKYLSAINNTPLMIRSSAVLGSSVLQGYNNSFQKCLFFLKTYHYMLLNFKASVYLRTKRRIPISGSLCFAGWNPDCSSFIFV